MSAPLRVMLLGASGLLGHDLHASNPAGVSVDLPTSGAGDRLDVTDAAAVTAALNRFRPDWVINATAYTDVDGAESNREAAIAVNGVGVARLSTECAARRIRVLHFSSDYVFPGETDRPYRESDVTGPLNEYGRSKLLGERALLGQPEARHVVVRTQWLFGSNGRSFPRTMWERARAKTPTRAVNDQFGSPTYTVDLALAAWRVICDGSIQGILHVTNDGSASWYLVARRVFERLGDVSLLTECTSAEFPRKAVRPAFSVLDTTKADAMIGRLPSWENAIDRFVDLLERENPCDRG